jgi:ribonucleoside-diphosphate reductase alpha chain
MPREKIPNRRVHYHEVLIPRYADGRDAEKIRLGMGEYADGRLGEIWLNHQKGGSFGNDILHALAVAISLGLQHGITIQEFSKTLKQIKMDPNILEVVFGALEARYPK